MTLTANYGLLLPKNYVFINSTEMEYVDGGWYVYTDFIAWGIDIALTAVGLNISAIGCLSSYALTNLAKSVWPKIGAKVAKYVGQTVASAVGSAIGRLGIVASALVAATSLGGMIAFCVDGLDGKMDSKFRW